MTKASASPRYRWLICVGFIAIGLGTMPPGDPAAARGAAEPGAFRTLPADFIENRGQWPDVARFAARGAGVVAVLEDHAIALHAPRVAAPAVRLAFEGRPAGLDRRRGRYNFYIGSERGRWRSDVPAFGAVVYRALYSGIDLVVRAEQGRLEYDVLVAPGADLDRIAVRAEGVSALEMASDGALLFHTAPGRLRQTPPRTWEVLPDGGRRPLASGFRILGPQRYGFEAPGRDPRLALVVDPGIEWSTFLGGSVTDFLAPAVPARDGSGDVFVGGTTNSPDFPLAADPSFSGFFQSRAFVARLDASGSAVLYATFIGGWHSQLVFRGLAVDAGGNAVLCGQTFSPDFPTTPGAVDRVGENKDAFVFRLNPTGGLIFSTFLGGFFEDLATSVAYDPAGNVIVGGVTASEDFPTTPNAFDPTYNAPNAAADGGAHGDMFVTRITPDGSQISYSTFIGGPSLDYLEDLVVDPQGFVTLAGWVTGNNVQVFVPTAGAFDATWNGSQDAAIARLKLDGAGAADLKYATLIGGASQDNLWSVAHDPVNPELVTFAGRSWSNDYPTTAGGVRPDNPPFSQLFPNVEAGVVTRFRFPATGGGTLVWSTYHHATRITGVTVNEAGEPIVVGPELPWDIPTTRGAVKRVARGSGAPSGSFTSRLSVDAARYVYQSFLGGSTGGEKGNVENSPRVAQVAGNAVIVSGHTTASDYPITPLAADPTSSNAVGGGASNEGFVTKIALDPDASGDLTASPPVLVSPADGITFHNGLIGRIEWSEVSDPSGVEAYEFQVAVRSDFARDFILFRGGITETEALIPPSVGLSGGLAQTTFFWRVRTADRVGNLSDWSPARAFTVSPTTGQPTVAFIQIHPSTGITGGTEATGMLHLYDPAPAGGLVARLTAHHDRTIGLDRTRTLPIPVSVPATVTIPEGSTSAPFSIETNAVSEVTGVTVVATVNGVGNQAGMSIAPTSAATPNAFNFSPATVTGGNPVTGTVTLSRPAPAGGTVVSLIGSNPAAASLPSTVTVPAGSSSASFAVTTSPVNVEIDVVAEAKSGGGRLLRSLYVRPGNLPRLTSMTISPTSVTGGGGSGGTLTFSAPIPLGTWPAFPDGVVRFSSSDPEVAAVFPGAETVLAGSTSHSFGIFTRGIPTSRQVTLSASYDDVTLSGVLTVGALTGVSISSLGANVSDLKGGEGGIATVRLAAPAAASLLVTVSTDHPELFASLPASVVVSTGSTTGSFAFVTSKSATATTPVTVTARYGESAASLALTVGPPAESSPPIIGLSLNPTTVDGGTSSTGAVTLKSAAPSGGAVVQLSSSNTGAATVPATVTVPAGATSAGFTVSTQAVAADTLVAIGGILHLSTSARLIVKAPPAPPPTPAAPTLLSPANDTKPPQPITFDWTDVTGAASYTIHIDDSSTFSAPLVVSQSVVPSQATIGGLPAKRLWWRVRAVNSAGVAGPWSTTRRVEPQAAQTAASLSSVSVSPTSVVGGSASQGTVTLTSGASSGGAVVTLASSNAGVAGVPASVTVAAGATSASFTVTTIAVSTSTSVTITATYNSVSRTATLTVSPASSGPLPAPTLISPANDARFAPGQTITFDWSDVSGAASYTLEIDDSNSFTAPLIMSQTVAVSQFSTNTLPTRTMWWRVRANSSSGAPGTWSAVRRFEVKD